MSRRYVAAMVWEELGASAQEALRKGGIGESHCGGVVVKAGVKTVFS